MGFGNFDGGRQRSREVDRRHQQGENRKLGGDDGDNDGAQLACDRIRVVGDILLHPNILSVASKPRPLLEGSEKSGTTPVFCIVRICTVPEGTPAESTVTPRRNFEADGKTKSRSRLLSSRYFQA